MIKFEKVSLEQYIKDMKEYFPLVKEDDIEKLYDNIKLPKRGSKYSAGYDIYSPMSFMLSASNNVLPSMFSWSQKPIVIPLGIKAQMPGDMFLTVVPRSGVGFKSGTYLANTIGIIDSDYYNNEKNEGHIMVKLVPGFDSLTVAAGDRIVQGIFTKYYITDDDEANETRNGGFGSTGNN